MGKSILSENISSGTRQQQQTIASSNENTNYCTCELIHGRYIAFLYCLLEKQTNKCCETRNVQNLEDRLNDEREPDSSNLKLGTAQNLYSSSENKVALTTELGFGNPTPWFVNR